MLALASPRSCRQEICILWKTDRKEIFFLIKFEKSHGARMNSLIAAQIFPEHHPFARTGALMNVAVTQEMPRMV